jgi:hypothetical protein
MQELDGIVLEEGEAVQAGDSANWIFTTGAANPSLAGDKITVYATDNPANLAIDVKNL